MVRQMVWVGQQYAEMAVEGARPDLGGIPAPRLMTWILMT
jgi:hypothetical protein